MPLRARLHASDTFYHNDGRDVKMVPSCTHSVRGWCEMAGVNWPVGGSSSRRPWRLPPPLRLLPSLVFLLREVRSCILARGASALEGPQSANLVGFYHLAPFHRSPRRASKRGSATASTRRYASRGEALQNCFSRPLGESPLKAAVVDPAWRLPITMRRE